MLGQGEGVCVVCDCLRIVYMFVSVQELGECYCVFSVCRQGECYGKVSELLYECSVHECKGEVLCVCGCVPIVLWVCVELLITVEYIRFKGWPLSSLLLTSICRYAPKNLSIPGCCRL